MENPPLTRSVIKPSTGAPFSNAASILRHSTAFLAFFLEKDRSHHSHSQQTQDKDHTGRQLL